MNATEIFERAKRSELMAVHYYKYYEDKIMKECQDSSSAKVDQGEMNTLNKEYNENKNLLSLLTKENYPKNPCVMKTDDLLAHATRLQSIAEHYYKNIIKEYPDSSFAKESQKKLDTSFKKERIKTLGMFTGKVKKEKTKKRKKSNKFRSSVGKQHLDHLVIWGMFVM